MKIIAAISLIITVTGYQQSNITLINNILREEMALYNYTYRYLL